MNASNVSSIPNSLSGKHLVVGILDYPPYGIIDRSKTGNAAWSGYDVAIMTKLATYGGFTYELKEVVHVPGNSWDVTMKLSTLQASRFIDMTQLSHTSSPQDKP